MMTIKSDVSADLQSQVGDVPQATWTDSQFAAYASYLIGMSTEIESSIGVLARRSTVAFFRAGMALSMVRDRRKPHGDWVAWQEQHNLKRTTVFEAIQLFEKAKVEEAVANLGLTDAKKRFGISGNGGRTADEQRQINHANNVEKAMRTPMKGWGQPVATPSVMLRVAAAQIDTAIAAVDVTDLAKEEIAALIERIKVQVARLETIMLSQAEPTAPVPSVAETKIQPDAA